MRAVFFCPRLRPNVRYKDDSDPSLPYYGSGMGINKKNLPTKAGKSLQKLKYSVDCFSHSCVSKSAKAFCYLLLIHVFHRCNRRRDLFRIVPVFIYSDQLWLNSRVSSG